MGRPFSFHEDQMADEANPEATKPAETAEPARKRLGKGEVRFRVMKRGHGKIHTGKDIPEDERFFKQGDEGVGMRENVERLEDDGFVEIL